MNFTDLIFAGLSYLIGSVSFAVVVSKLMRLPDPHSYGSGNPGATNVLRTGNKKAAIFTLLGDLLKGVLAVILARTFAPQFGGSEAAAALAALFVFIGHCYPIFHGFKGGKGVATAGGVILAADWRLGLALVATWLAIAAISRMSSLAGLVAAGIAPALAFYWLGNALLALALTIIAIILFIRHRSNIAKIIAGTEGKIGQKKTG